MSAKTEWAQSWLEKANQNFIDGEWRSSESDHEFSVINPATENSIGSYLMASRRDVDRAVEAAQKCFDKKSWRSKPMRERARLMRKIAEVAREHFSELATLESLQNGKTYLEAFNDDMPDSASIFEYYAGWIDKHYGETCPVEPGFLNYTLKEPLGVCGLIVPWNFPLLMACWKLAPAIAMGNSVVIKPSEYTPYSLVRFFEVIHEKVDLPDGLLNLVLGDGPTGNHLTEHMGVHKVSFTGSTGVGKKIVGNSANSNLKSVSLELGGKSPNLFFEDTADLDAAIDRSFQVMFSHKGEKCSEPTRFYFHESIYKQALDKMKAMADQVVCGDPLAESTSQGPQCYKGHFEKVMSYVEAGKAEGAQLVCGGKAETVSGKGYFVPPTIFSDVRPEMKISKEEIFGPVLSVASFKTEEEAVALANASEYGLAAGLYTSDVSRAHRLAGQLEAGMVFINHYGCYDFSSPFGGYKQSGWGKDMAIHSLDSYTKTKSVWVKI